MRHAVILVGLVTAGCGGDTTHHLADAPTTMIDGPAPIDAAPLPVTLTVTNAGVPSAGIQVWFQESDSTLVSSTTTDATGVATAVVEPGAFVTALNPFPHPAPSIVPANLDDLRTFAGVKPGDHLVLDQPAVGTQITFTMSLPVDPGAVTYLLNTSCGTADLSPSGGSGSLPGGNVTLQGCANGAADMLLVTSDANGQPQSFIFDANVPVENAGTVDLTTKTYAAVVDTTFNYTSAPASVTFVDLQQVIAGTRGQLFTSFSNGDITAGAGTVTLALPGTAGEISIEDSAFRPTSVTQQDVIDWGPYAATYTLDMTSVLLPDFTEAPALDIANHQLTWSEDTGAAPDFSVIEFQIDRTDSWTWEIAAPYSAATLKLPVLPADGAAFNPATGDTSNIFITASAKVPGGYDAVRANLLSDLGIQPVNFVAGASGRAVLARFQQVKAGIVHGHHR